MTARQMASLVLEVLRLGVALVLLVLLVLLAAVALRAVGVVLPVRGLGHVEIAAARASTPGDVVRALRVRRIRSHHRGTQA